MSVTDFTEGVSHCQNDVMDTETANAGEGDGRGTVAESSATTPVREGKTQRTRRALGLAALDLFETRGVENVTAADIAAQAGVTERTFFRHFRSKEEAALLIHQRFEDALMSSLPAVGTESPQQILHEVYRRVLSEYEERDSPQTREMLRVQVLVAKSPQLRLASLRRDDERAEELVAYLRSRPGAQPQSDELQVRMAVEATGVAVRVASAEWSASDGSVSLAELFDRCMRTLFGVDD